MFAQRLFHDNVQPTDASEARMTAPNEVDGIRFDRPPRELNRRIAGIPLLVDPDNGNDDISMISDAAFELMTSFSLWRTQGGAANEAVQDESMASPTAARTIAILNKFNGCAGKKWIGEQWGFPVSNPNLSNSQWNDKASSLSFEGARDAIVSVFDSRNYGLNDDFTVMIKTDDDPVCVRTFERAPSGRWIVDRGYTIFYSGGNNLDGKVSSIRFGRWW